jgi:hypothetical protein
MVNVMSASSTSVAFLRPMYWASSPSGNRISAPATMGMASSVPFCAGVSWNCSLMNGAMAPLSTQMTNENVR